MVFDIFVDIAEHEMIHLTNSESKQFVSNRKTSKKNNNEKNIKNIFCNKIYSGLCKTLLLVMLCSIGKLFENWILNGKSNGMILNEQQWNKLILLHQTLVLYQY